jgi:hypothetical protein
MCSPAFLKALYGLRQSRDNTRVQRSTKAAYATSPLWRVLRLLLFAAGIVTIFWFFFSFIGVLIGVLLFAFSRDPRWRAHGFMLGLSAAISEFAAYTGTGLAPLHLGMRTGPSVLTGYLLVFVLLTLMRRHARKKEEPGARGRPKVAGRLSDWTTAALKLGGSIWKRARIPLTAILIALPVGLWASVSIHPGVLFDNSPRMLWVHAPSTVAPGQKFTVAVQAWDAYERLSAAYRGTVRFALESYDANGSAVETVTGAAYSADECYHKDGKTYINRYSDNPVDSESLDTGGADFYLIRVVGANGRSAYAGPIWVTAGP